MGATLALLDEVGYSALSLEMVARRARVGKPSIYRRWPGKASLVVDTIVTIAGTDPAPDTGSLRDDLRAVALAMAALYRTPLARTVVLPLLGDLADDPDLGERFRRRYVAPRRGSVHRALERAQERGEIPRVDDPELICDLIAGPLFHRAFLVAGEIDDRFALATVDAVLIVLESGQAGDRNSGTGKGASQ
ncbi:TetR/AcrR family transcriptional regulator [Acidimicrobium ferrooxidans]|nr:TetR/AcrR family transcriptional regulator [Acidimicrobium ferrooxidans]